MNRLLLLLLLAAASSFCQDRKPLTGKAMFGNNGIADVYVINKVTGVEVKTNATGIFLIHAKPGDIIVVYSPKINVREFAISNDSFKEGPYIVEVTTSALELDEVVVDGSITSENLNIVPENQKRFTPAERKLYTAGDFKPVMLLGLLAGGMQLDPVFNAINGKTKSLKKQVALEKREMLLQNLHNICTASEIINDFEIPDEHVDGFLYFVAEDNEVATLLNEGNQVRAKFRITELAQRYTALIKDE